MASTTRYVSPAPASDLIEELDQSCVWGPQQLSIAWVKYWIEWPTIGVYKIASMM
jgi:hypothetical protein